METKKLLVVIDAFNINGNKTSTVLVELIGENSHEYYDELEDHCPPWDILWRDVLRIAENIKGKFLAKGWKEVGFSHAFTKVYRDLPLQVQRSAEKGEIKTRDHGTFSFIYTLQREA